jgi:hypothetical protein
VKIRFVIRSSYRHIWEFYSPDFQFNGYAHLNYFIVKPSNDYHDGIHKFQQRYFRRYS